IHYFFFSSRRRHTRFSRDWSSDVCSSDLQVASPRYSVRTQGTQATGAVTWTGHLWLSPEGRAALAAAQANVAAARKEWQDAMARSEERRVGKEGRSRWSPNHKKKD